MRNPFYRAIKLKRSKALSFRPSRLTEYSLTQLGYLMFLVSVFLVPFDSFPIFPTSSVYRPISVLCLLVSFVAIFVKGKLHKQDLVILGVVVYIIVHSFLTSVILFQEYSQLFKVVLTTGLLFVILFSFQHTFRDHLMENEDEFMRKITQIIIYSLTFISILGFIQFFSSLGLIPRGLSYSISKLFTYRVTHSGRVQMVSGEPVWLFRHLAFFWPFIAYYYKGPRKKLFLGLIILFIFLSGSTYAYLSIVLLLLVYILFFQLSFKNLFRGSLILVVFFVVFLVLKERLPKYTIRKIESVVEVASDAESLEIILASDGSIFTRLINPYIGFISGPSSNYLGVGLDNYRYIYDDYIIEHFSYARSFGTIDDILSGQVYATPKSLFSKIFSELGLIPFILYMFFLAYLFWKIKQQKHDQRKYKFLSISFCLLIIFTINGDSIIFYDFFFLIMLILALTRPKQTKEVEVAEPA